MFPFPLKAIIKIENASFGYGGSANVLRNVSIEINKGEMVGIVGRSGAGKTTLINLILRLYDVEDGKNYSGRCRPEGYITEFSAFSDRYGFAGDFSVYRNCL